MIAVLSAGATWMSFQECGRIGHLEYDGRCGAGFVGLAIFPSNVTLGLVNGSPARSVDDYLRSIADIFGSDPSWLVDQAKGEDSRVESIRIPGRAITKIKRQLRDAGITESVVYPDLDGLGRELKQLWHERR